MYTLIPEERETTRLPNSYKNLLQDLPDGKTALKIVQMLAWYWSVLRSTYLM